MRLNIVTPCSRPENLLAIQKSINSFCAQYKNNFEWDIDCVWHIIFEQSKLDSIVDRTYIKYLKSRLDKNNQYYWNTSNGIAGHTHRNFILNKLSGQTGWVYFNDDDNIIHKDFAEVSFNQEDAAAIVFSQKTSDGQIRSYEGIQLLAAPENMKLRHIDTAQLVYNLYNIGSLMFDDRYYWADGLFSEEFYKRHKNVLFYKKLFCYYNFLNTA